MRFDADFAGPESLLSCSEPLGRRDKQLAGAQRGAFTAYRRNNGRVQATASVSIFLNNIYRWSLNLGFHA